MTIEMKFDTDQEARNARRDLINQGRQVSLLAFDPSREKHIFDLLD